jgi:hypothetical protein
MERALPQGLNRQRKNSGSRVKMAKEARPRLKPAVFYWPYARVETLASLRREFFGSLWSTRLFSAVFGTRPRGYAGHALRRSRFRKRVLEFLFDICEIGEIA